MTLQARLDEDLKAALRAGDALRVSTIRLARAAVKNAEIERRRPLTDEEIEAVLQYLPTALSEEELRRLIGEAVAELGASSPREMGRVMAVLMPRLRARADGALVGRLVWEALGG